MGRGSGKTNQVQGGTTTNDDHIGMPAHRIFVEIRPDRFNQGPIIFGRFSSTDEYGRANQVQSFFTGPEITFDLIRQVGVPVQNTLVQINQGLGLFAFSVRLQDIGQSIIGRGKGIFGEEYGVGDIQSDVSTNCGIG